jgi:CBS domain-containing protein
MLVRELMTSHAATAEVDESLQAVARRMKELGVGALPVLERGALVGFVTDRDIVVRAVAAGEDPVHATVRSAMTPQAITCRDDDELPVAARRMEERAVRRLMVVDAKGELVGMLSVEDLASTSVALAAEVLQHGREPWLPVHS